MQTAHKMINVLVVKGLKPPVDQNIALHVSPAAMDSAAPLASPVLSLCTRSTLPGLGTRRPKPKHPTQQNSGRIRTHDLPTSRQSEALTRMPRLLVLRLFSTEGGRLR